MEFLSVYKRYINTLESISNDHDELTDTDVRERLHEVINWYFIWGNPIDKNFPKKYAMFSEEGNALVAKATQAFVENAIKAMGNIPVGQKRNDLIENTRMKSDSGTAYYFFLGSIEKVLPPSPPASDEIYSDED